MQSFCHSDCQVIPGQVSMKKNVKRKLIPFLGILIVLLACELPAISVSFAATPLPSDIGTIIFETVAAAQTQTAVFLPSSTPTPTPTETVLPISTSTETPTPTETIVFVFPTSTRTRTVTPTDDGLSDEDWVCRLISTDPANNQVIDPRKDFDARWVVRNIGERTWRSDEVDYIYYSGTEMHKSQAYDLSKNVTPGETVTITVDMIAPRNEGTYSTTWTLRSGRTQFCRLSISIVVK